MAQQHLAGAWERPGREPQMGRRLASWSWLGAVAAGITDCDTARPAADVAASDLGRARARPARIAPPQLWITRYLARPRCLRLTDGGKFKIARRAGCDRCRPRTDLSRGGRSTERSKYDTGRQPNPSPVDPIGASRGAAHRSTPLYHRMALATILARAHPMQDGGTFVHVRSCMNGLNSSALPAQAMRPSATP
jgi:hypothetical protein